MNSDILNQIIKNKIIAIVRKVDDEKIEPLAEALCQGGIRLVEVTFDQSGEVSDEVISKQIALLASKFEGILSVGAGTVMSTKQVELAYRAGAKYIISPNIDKKVIQKTTELGMISIPGATTPTEMVQANRWGADFVKLFPAGELGLGYIKAVLAPLNHIKTLAVGGIDEKNLGNFLKSGIYGVGIGSNIVKKELIHQGKFNEITKLAKKYVNQI